MYPNVPDEGGLAHITIYLIIKNPLFDAILYNVQEFKNSLETK